MGITINGIHFNGNNVTIVNGRVVSGGSFFGGEPKKIDEQKSTSANSVSRIVVNCDCANVQMKVANTNSVNAHFFGQVTTDGTTKFDVSTSGSEIKITVKLTGNSINSDLHLHIDIPARMFETIDVKSENGNIIISEGVRSRKLKLKSTNGNVESYAVFEDIKAKSMNGNTEVCVYANSDVDLDVSSMNGNAIVELHNIARCNLSTSSMNGSVRNRFHATTGYTADGEVSSMNGNVRVN